MAMVKKSITVTDQQDKWIQSQMKTGHYGTDSELIREALREKEARDGEVEYIQSKLIAAEQSGFIDRGRDEILTGFKDRLRANGEL